MDSEYEEDVLSILRGRKGWNKKYASISEFKKQLEGVDLAQQKLQYGWVLWRENERQEQILTLLQSIASDWSMMHYLVQFWGVLKVEGRHHHLSTLNYPFCVGELRKGICWYRKQCRDHVFVVDIDDDDQEQLKLIGGVGRAYRNKQPESTPDLRLYSTTEFPMRNEAARCGFRGYLALPLFHSHTNTSQCFGVLEILWDDTASQIRRFLLSKLDEALQIAGFRSTHTSIISGFATKMQPESEITEILEMAMATVPRLYLALVWAPCKQCVCVNMMNTYLCCMEITSFISCQNKIVNSHHDVGFDMNEYLEACEFHNLQIDLSCLDSSLRHLSISMNPLAHYAQKARISHSFAVCLINFLQPNFRECGDYSLHLLSSILEMNLKTFEFMSGERLVSESRNPESLNVIKFYKHKLSQSNFITYLEMDESCCLRPSPEDSCQGWVFGNNNNSLLVPIMIKEKMENFMKNMQVNWTKDYWIIQFWAPKMEENRCYLQALDQPYVVGCLSKGLASFRKKCTTHSYFVDDQAKEEELGPPGRVFRNGHPEVSPNLFHYTTKEYPIRNYAMHCCALGRGYFAYPIFEDDEHNHKSCVGVLEFVAFYPIDHYCIRRALEEAELCSTHTNFYPTSLADTQAVNTIYCRKEALTELGNALKLICEIPQLYMANVWVPNRQCVTSINSNTSCMELELSRDHLGISSSVDQVRRIHVHSRKGMVGMVLASENKSCFCPNVCEFSITDQPTSHYEMSDRREFCFAICLQSSHTGDLVYVVEFYLYKGPKIYEYLRSFLNFLGPIMKHQLKSFKMASGKELGEELVVEVIEFSDANEVNSFESEQAHVFPIKFKNVQYSQQEHQHREEQQIEECSVVVEHQHTEDQQIEECSVVVEHQHTENQQIEECSVAASGSKTRERGKRKTGLNLSLEILSTHFGKKLNDVAEELGIGKSTIKRACRRYGINRWPTKEKYKRNPSLFEREYGQQDIDLPSTSNLQPLDSSLHRNLPHTNTKEKVIIKVKYEEDIIKFELYLSLGLTKLMEEVCTRLNLEKGAFKLKYLDEDGDEILLTNDDDLQLCRKTQITMNKTYIQLFVRL